MISLEELARAYQSGDTGALDEIIERCSYIVRNVSRRYFLIGADGEDLYQEGFLGLIKAAKSYEEGKSSFKYFAFLCVHTSVLTAVRRYSGDKNKTLNDGVPLSVLDETAFTENPEEIYIEGESSREFISDLKKGLSSFENKILSLYLQGLTYAEMQESTGRSFKSIDNALQRIKNKLKKRTANGGKRV